MLLLEEVLVGRSSIYSEVLDVRRKVSIVKHESPIKPQLNEQKLLWQKPLLHPALHRVQRGVSSRIIVRSAVEGRNCCHV